MIERVIYKYKNRKLYDKRYSKYVTLLEIAEFIKRGEQVNVRNKETDKDLTNVTLAQAAVALLELGDAPVQDKLLELVKVLSETIPADQQPVGPAST